MSDVKIFTKQVCPKCGKNDVEEGGHVVIDGEYAYQEVTCACGMRYFEVYKYWQTEVYNWCEEEA